jgi:GTP-binding protein
MDITKVQFVKSIKKINQRPLPLNPEVAVVGRSNVGKSSLINTLFNRRHLAKISSTPGKTRLINYFLVDKEIYLVDLPGYGYTKILNPESRNWQSLIEYYLKENKQLKMVLLLIDCRHLIMNLDLLMIDWFKFYHIPFKIILTKKDKLSNLRYTKQLLELRKEFSKSEIFGFSAKTKEGREEILGLLCEMGKI